MNLATALHIFLRRCARCNKIESPAKCGKCWLIDIVDRAYSPGVSFGSILAVLPFKSVMQVAFPATSQGTFSLPRSRMDRRGSRAYREQDKRPTRTELLLSIAVACWPCFQGETHDHGSGRAACPAESPIVQVPQPGQPRTAITARNLQGCGRPVAGLQLRAVVGVRRVRRAAQVDDGPAGKHRDRTGRRRSALSHRLPHALRQHWQ
ncbi:hypothetical protein D3C81_1077770 [compost metagenome]